MNLKLLVWQYVCVPTLCLISLSVNAADEPSSVIPEKREFVLNSDINPCDDFHAYVCSNVEKSFKLREDRNRHNFAFHDSSERILEKKKDFFKNIDREKKLSPRALQVKNFYKSCMDESSRITEEKVLTQKLINEVQQIKTLDQFVKLNRKSMTNENWSYLSYDRWANTDNPKIYDINFNTSLMYLPEQSYYKNAELMEAYRDLIVAYLDILEPEGQNHKTRAQAIINFESRFKDTYPLPAEFRQRWTQPRYVTRDAFFKRTSINQLDQFFKQNIPNKTLIRDFIPESFEFIQNNFTAENLQILKDIYLFRNAQKIMDDAYPDLYKKFFDFNNRFLGGPPVRSDRQERCTRETMNHFNFELDQELLPRVFPNFPTEKMVSVTQKIRESILNGIRQNTWLSDESRKGALEKIQQAKLQIIKPQSNKEWDFKPIQKYLPTQFYENKRRWSHTEHQFVLKGFREGVNQAAWQMSPLTVNAYYTPDVNKFVMPIGILQYPFFIADGDLIENLGAVGAIVGHELGHSIDDEGAKFNAQGQMKQWMKDADITQFKARGEKMIAQFDKAKHNGALTLGENVADLVGMTFGYQAAFPNNQGSVEDKKKFFIAYGRLWCGVMREKTREKYLKTDPHSLGEARINEQVKHQSGFQDAFQCKPKNKLYLSEADRIKIW